MGRNQVAMRLEKNLEGTKRWLTFLNVFLSFKFFGSHIASRHVLLHLAERMLFLDVVFQARVLRSEISRDFRKFYNLIWQNLNLTNKRNWDGEQTQVDREPKRKTVAAWEGKGKVRQTKSIPCAVKSKISWNVGDLWVCFDSGDTDVQYTCTQLNLGA